MDESIRLGGQAVLTVRGPARLLSRTSERAVFLTLVVLMIVPLWLFTYYPSTDGPVHLNIATIMNGYDDPDASRIRAFFRFNGNIEPNVVAHHLIAALDAAAGDILVAEKIFLTLWVLLFCLSTRALVLAVRSDGGPDGAVVSYLFLPTVFNYFAHDGYYNFILGMALCFLALALWYPRRDRLRPWQMALLGGFGVVIVWTHLFSLLMLIFLIGVITTFDHGLAAWRAADRAALKGIAADYLKRALALVAAFAPAMYFTFSFVLRHGLTAATSDEQEKLRLLKHLASMSHLYSFDRIEAVFFVPFLALVTGMAAWLAAQRWRQRRLLPADGFLLALVCLLGIYMFVPVTTKEVAISQRFLGYILAVGIFWLASLRLPPRSATALVAGVAALVVAITAYRAWMYDLYNRKLETYVSAAEHVEPNSTVLALHYWKQREPLAGERITWRTDPFRHAASYIAMRTNGVDLRSSMMAESVYGYFPVVYRSRLDPYAVMGDVESNPPEVDLLGFDDRTGETIDYVLVWAYDGSTPDDPLHRQLALAYEPAYASPDGLVQLYRRIDAGRP